MIAKSKLNSCAHCASRKNLHAVFTSDGKLYFICSVHKLLLDKLIEAAAKAGVDL